MTAHAQALCWKGSSSHKTAKICRRVLQYYARRYSDYRACGVCALQSSSHLNNPNYCFSALDCLSTTSKCHIFSSRVYLSPFFYINLLSILYIILMSLINSPHNTKSCCLSFSQHTVIYHISHTFYRAMTSHAYILWDSMITYYDTICCLYSSLRNKYIGDAGAQTLANSLQYYDIQMLE